MLFLFVFCCYNAFIITNNKARSVVMKIGFNNPVCCKEVSNPIKECPKFNFVDDYFKWSGSYYVLEPNQPSSKSSLRSKQIVKLSPHQYRQNTLRKVLKIMTYLSVIIPIIMLFAKIISRVYAKNELVNAPSKGGKGDNPKGINGEKSVNDLIKFNQVKKELNFEGLKFKPTNPPVPTPKLDTEIADLTVLAQSVGLSNEGIVGIQNLCDVATGADETSRHIAIYLKAIIEIFNKNDVQVNLKKEVMTNLGRDCGVGVCNPGRLTKIQKEYGRLFGVDSDSVNEIILYQISDLKFDILNQVAHDARLRISECMHPHFISAAQVIWDDRFGLDGAAGARDRSHVSEIRNVTEGAADIFLEFYTPQTLVESVLGKLNANTDDSGAAMHIEKYNDFIKTSLLADGFEKPDTLDGLHPDLKKYENGVIEDLPAVYKNNLDEIYKGVLDEYIKEHYIQYADVNDIGDDSPAFLKQEGLEFILVSLGILMEPAY